MEMGKHLWVKSGYHIIFITVPYPVENVNLFYGTKMEKTVKDRVERKQVNLW